MSGLLIARHSAIVVLDGTPNRVRRGRTVAHVDSAVARARPELWRPIVVDHPAAGGATRISINVAGSIDSDRDLIALVRDAISKNRGGILPGAPPAAASGDAGKPTPKEVREWARAEGIEVPARGPLPDDVLAAYRAAQGQ